MFTFSVHNKLLIFEGLTRDSAPGHGALLITYSLTMGGGNAQTSSIPFRVWHC